MTAVTLSYAPINAPLVDERGYASRSFAQWLSQGLWLRVGKARAMSNDDITSELETQPMDLGLLMLAIQKAVEADGRSIAPVAPIAPSKPSSPLPAPAIPTMPVQAIPARPVVASLQMDPMALIQMLISRVASLEQKIGALTTGVLP